MKKQEYSVHVKASAKVAFNTMLGLDNRKTYELWTAVFNPTSTCEGTWEKGAKMLFVGTDENGKRGGMVSRIAEFIPNQFVSIQHFGMLDGDAEITNGPEVEKWAGGLENYTFSEQNGITTIRVEIDVVEEYLDYFNNTYPNALIKLKDVIEQQ